MSKPSSAKRSEKAKPTSKPSENKTKLCAFKGCKSRPLARTYCKEHKIQVRKAQLKANNIAWRKRVKAGIVKEKHLVYRGKPTYQVSTTKKGLAAAEKYLANLKKAGLAYRGPLTKRYLPVVVSSKTSPKAGVASKSMKPPAALPKKVYSKPVAKTTKPKVSAATKASSTKSKKPSPTASPSKLSASESKTETPTVLFSAPTTSKAVMYVPESPVA